MKILMDIVQSILDLGASVILPIVITILGLFFKMKFGNALKAGLTVGVGFLGLSLVVQLLNSTLKPAVDYYQTLGKGFTIVDIGWPAVGAASWTAPFAALAIPLGLILNIFLIRIRATKTMNVDIWNYIHYLIPGAMAYFLFRSFLLGLFVTLVMSCISLLVADRIAGKWQDYFELEGTTCTTIMFTGWAWPVAWLVNKIIDYIPGLNKLDLDIQKVNKRMGPFGDPIIIGLFVGILLGLLTKQPYTTILVMGMGVAGVMVLMPRMVSVLMDGLSPIGTAAKKVIATKTGGDSELNIGMDIALGLGDPCAITTTVVTIPLVILSALVLPGVKFFPVGMLMVIVYISVMCTLISKGNLIRSILSTWVFCILTMYLAAYVAPGATEMLKGSGVGLEGLGTDTTIAEPWNLVIYWLSTLFN